MTHLTTLCLATVVGASGPAAPPRFALSDLGTLPGGLNSEALDINDTGVIVGSSNFLGTSYHSAVMWAGGRIIDLTGNGFSGALADAVNDAGQVVGGSDELPSIAFLWDDGVVSALPVSQVCCTGALGLARGINGIGRIVGTASFAGFSAPGQAVLWQDGLLVALPTLGGTSSVAHDINDAGTIVGYSETEDSNVPTAVMWNNGVIQALPSLGGDSGFAAAINADGLIVGESRTRDDQIHAVVWHNGIGTDLGTLGATSHARGVNDAGWIVGHSYLIDPWQQHAVLWADGRMYDLNAITVRPPNAVIAAANAINDNQRIVGSAVFGVFQAPHAALLTPIPSADVSGDGSVGVDDLLGVINSWDPCPPQPAFCAADVSPAGGGDGAVNVDDLLAVINAWRPCR